MCCVVLLYIARRTLNSCCPIQFRKAAQPTVRPTNPRPSIHIEPDFVCSPRIYRNMDAQCSPTLRGRSENTSCCCNPLIINFLCYPGTEGGDNVVVAGACTGDHLFIM